MANKYSFLLLIVSLLLTSFKDSMEERSYRHCSFLDADIQIDNICYPNEIKNIYIFERKKSKNIKLIFGRSKTAGFERLFGFNPDLRSAVEFGIKYHSWAGGEREPDSMTPDPELYETLIDKKQHDFYCLPPDSLIINDYAAVYNFDKCNNFLIVDDATGFNKGDTVLLIQMKGVVIDSSNSGTFGDIIDYRNAGNYEYNFIKFSSGDKIYLSNELLRDYDFESGIVQLVRVPFYSNLNISTTLTAMPWDGKKGGVLCFNVSDTINMGADIDVTGKGFRGGSGLNNSIVTMNESGFYYDISSNKGGEKGEGVALISSNRRYGRGALANGGGGGNAHNAGGGGGGNGGAGGDGGDEYEPFKILTESIGGKGGKALANSALINKLFLGGAGGMGHANDFAEFPAGNGGGIIIISAKTLINSSFSIKANGENAGEAPSPESSKDGMAGGGGGGSIFLDIQHVINQVDIQVKGGKGADQPGFAFNGKYGPGGGGGGGVLAISQASILPQYQPEVSGGINGRNTNLGNDPWRSQKGENGIIIPNFKRSVAVNAFVSNIDSVNINAVISNCDQVEFKGEAPVKKYPIKEWTWDFGNNTFSNLKDPIHNYLAEGIFSG
ncbi:MAG: PKD domain-containing protein [Candidatus Kuenenia stuttgartiensis]|nr:PKD domain-containing protein [Candidatus Kuenenia stuttgartiensis]